MRKDILVYISGPIAPANGYTVEQNIKRGLEYYLKFCKLNIPSILPHMTAAFPETSIIDYDTWLEYDFRMIDRCTHVFMMPDWSLSKGAIKEFNYAIQNNKTVLLYWEMVEDLTKVNTSKRKKLR